MGERPNPYTSLARSARRPAERSPSPLRHAPGEPGLRRRPRYMGTGRVLARPLRCGPEARHASPSQGPAARTTSLLHAPAGAGPAGAAPLPCWPCWCSVPRLIPRLTDPAASAATRPTLFRRVAPSARLRACRSAGQPRFSPRGDRRLPGRLMVDVAGTSGRAQGARGGSVTARSGTRTRTACRIP